MPVVQGPGIGAFAAGPCEWPVNTDCVAGWDTFTPEAQARGTALATFVLDALTGHQFAQCPVTVRPCGDGCRSFTGYMTYPVGAPSPNVPGPWMVPFVRNGSWFNCLCGGSCPCKPACRVDLGLPVASVDEVKIDGLVLDPSAYTLVGQYLARTDGGECWPSCQDPAVPDTEDGTFAVTYRPGRTLPPAGEIAAGLLAGEFARACTGGACALPPQISSLSRQGVDVEFLDPTEVAGAGRTGIREVDLFIESVNPYGRRQRAVVMSPDVRVQPVRY